MLHFLQNLLTLIKKVYNEKNVQISVQITYFYACLDFRGGFYLQPIQNTLQGHSGHVSPSCSFTSLLDVPIDSYTSGDVRSCSLSPTPSAGSVRTDSAHSTHNGRRPPHSPNRRQNGLSWHDEVPPLSVSEGRVGPERGRSPVRRADRGRREASPDSTDGRPRKQEGYTEVSIRVPSQRRTRTPLADVFEQQRDKHPSVGRGSGQRLNGAPGSSNLQPAKYESKTVPISKSRPSLGEFNRDLYI